MYFQGKKLDSKLEKIDDYIYILKGTTSSNIYYLDFEKKAIIDTGHPNDCKNNYEIFKKGGFLLDEIDYILNTHSHGDHVGGNVYFKKLNPGVKIFGSKYMYKYQSLRKNTGILKGSEDDFDEYTIDVELNENDVIDLGNTKLIVYETPGHTDDSISFYLKDKKYLFSGDVIYNKVITQVNYYKDFLVSLEELITSYKKLEDIDTVYLFPGHGPFIENVQDNIKSCLRKLERFKKNPEMIIINIFVPSAEYYIHKNNGCLIENLKEYFIKNTLKFKHYSVFKNIKPDDFDSLTNKVISLMKIMNLIKIKDNRIFLINELNQYIELNR